MQVKQGLVIGTRSSKLALWQANFVAAALRKFFPQTDIALEKISTKGDKILDVPLAKIGGKGLFTKEIERALLEEKIDIAVHSLKDMPAKIPDGLAIAAFSAREEARDAFIGKCAFSRLPGGAKIGTSSLRRRAQLLRLRPDLNIVDLRGNVDTRLAKFAAGEFDGIILAAAGLSRLNLADKITELLPPDIMLPAVGQGILAIETREADESTRQLVCALHDGQAACCAKAERAFLQKIGGSCQIPVGALATVENGVLSLEAMIASIDGKEMFRQSLADKAANAAQTGEELALRLLDAGGRRVLNELVY